MATREIEILRRSIAILYAYTRQRNIGVMCASRDHQSPDERDAASYALQADIRAAGFGVIPIQAYFVNRGGTTDEHRVQDRFYLIIGNKGNVSGNVKGFLRKQALKYDQQAVLLKPCDSEIAEVHYRDGRVDMMGNWHPDRISEFYAILKGIARPDFVFDEVHFLEGRTWFNRSEHDICHGYSEGKE